MSKAVIVSCHKTVRPISWASQNMGLMALSWVKRLVQGSLCTSWLRVFCRQKGFPLLHNYHTVTCGTVPALMDLPLDWRDRLRGHEHPPGLVLAFRLQEPPLGFVPCPRSGEAGGDTHGHVSSLLWPSKEAALKYKQNWDFIIIFP